MTKKINYLVSTKFDFSFRNSKNEIDLKKENLSSVLSQKIYWKKMINKVIVYSFPIECFEKFRIYNNKNFRKFKKFLILAHILLTDTLNLVLPMLLQMDQN